MLVVSIRKLHLHILLTSLRILYIFRVKKNELKGVAKEVTGKDIVKNLLKYTWPRGRSSEERAVKCSLITSLLLMVASKVTVSNNEWWLSLRLRV